MTHILKEEDKNESVDFNFAASVAWFGMMIRNSEYLKKQNVKDVIQLAQDNRGADTDGYRAEFIRLVKSYQVSGLVVK